MSGIEKFPISRQQNQLAPTDITNVSNAVFGILKEPDQKERLTRDAEAKSANHAGGSSVDEYTFSGPAQGMLKAC